MEASSAAPPSASATTTTTATRANGHRAPNYGSFESSRAPTIRVDNFGQQQQRQEPSKVAINWEAAKSAASTEKKRPPSEESGLLFRLARRIPCLGIMLALMASLFLGSAGMLVKLTRSVHGIQVAVLR